jgi:hypothetical protein
LVVAGATFVAIHAEFGWGTQPAFLMIAFVMGDSGGGRYNSAPAELLLTIT